MDDCRQLEDINVEIEEATQTQTFKLLQYFTNCKHTYNVDNDKSFRIIFIC